MLKFARSVAFIFMFISFIALSSCHARFPWVQVSDVPFDKVRYDHITDTIWLADWQEKAVYRLARPNNDRDFGNAERIATMNDSWITDICASNGVWVSSFVFSMPSKPIFNPEPPIPNTISRYTDETESWQTVGVTDQIAPCKPLKDGGVVFWSQNELMRFNTTNTQPQYIKTDWEISYVTDDLDGNLWVSTATGEIYRQTQNAWVLVDKLSSDSYPKLFVDNSGNLWVAGGNRYIYKFSTSNSAFSQEKILESSLGMWQDFFQDNGGTIWLATSDRLLAQKDGQFQEVGLPPDSKLLQFGFFDNETNTLFVSTEKGVFALNLDKYYAVGQ